MSGIRQGFCFCRERTFRGGKDEEDFWIAPPPGSFLSTTHNRTTNKLYTTGSKFYDTVAYGQVSGSWEWTFVFDYEYIEPFLLALESAECTSYEDKAYADYTLTKSNNIRLPSFCIRRKILNDMTGRGGQDEETILYGCVVKALRFSKTSGGSQINVTMTGFYAYEETVLGDLVSTDYMSYTGSLVEFSCMFISSIANSNYVAHTESLTIGVENSAGAVTPVCTPFASTYYEGQTSITFGTTCYSNDPERYKMRVYGGGERATGETIENNGRTLYRPRSKGMKPIDKVLLASYNGTADGFDDDVATVYGKSDRRICVILDDVVIKSLTWQKGDGSKLQDQINSTECRTFTLEIRSGNTAGIENIWGEANPHGIPGSGKVPETPGTAGGSGSQDATDDTGSSDTAVDSGSSDAN